MVGYMFKGSGVNMGEKIYDHIGKKKIVSQHRWLYVYPILNHIYPSIYLSIYPILYIYIYQPLHSSRIWHKVNF